MNVSESRTHEARFQYFFFRMIELNEFRPGLDVPQKSIRIPEQIGLHSFRLQTTFFFAHFLFLPYTLSVLSYLPREWYTTVVHKKHIGEV